MKKTITAIATLALVLGGGVTAQATNDSEPGVDRTHDEYIEVTWTVPISSDQPMPTGANSAPTIWPQMIGETCGMWLQVDRYKINEDTEFLISEGTLDMVNGTPQDSEILNYDHPFEETDKPWKFVKAPDCAEPDVKEGAESSQNDYCDSPLNGTRIFHTTKTSWTQVEGQDKVWAKPVVTTETVDDPECDPVHEPESAPEPELESPETDVATPAVPVEAEATFTG